MNFLGFDDLARHLYPVVCLLGKRSVSVQNQVDIESLRSELADKKAMLADLEAGKISLGAPFEDREAGIRRRIAVLESEIRKYDAARS